MRIRFKISYIFYLIILVLFLLPVVVNGQSRPRNYNRKNTIILGNKNRSKPKNYKRKKGPTRIPYQNKINNNNHVDFGINFGACNSLTDIGGKQKYSTNSFLDMQLPTTKFAPGAYGRYKFSRILGVSAAFNYGRIEGADSLSVNTVRYKRGFYYNNEIYELLGRVELYIPSAPKSKNYNTLFNYYFYSGVGAFYHFPSLGGPNRPDLNIIKKLPRSYSLYQVAIPFGTGFTLNVKEYWKVGYEIGWRMTFTDYLDGFTRPASKHNDSYVFTNITVGYVINMSSRYKHYKRKMLLPKNFNPF